MPDAPKKVFISYARADAVELAQRLRTDLAAAGYAPWLDTDRIAAGASWTDAIEWALDEASVVLALLSQGSYVSEICRAEQLRALRKGKCVIPLLAKQPTDVPLHLEAKNYRDFSNSGVYDDRFRALVDDIEGGNGVTLRDEFRRTYVTAPPLPENFVPRPEALAALRDAVLRERLMSNLPLTALIGMGGIGKSRLAQALCGDEVVQQAFPDGVVWVTAGKEPSDDLVTRFREVGKALGDDLSFYDNELACRNRYRTTIRHKAALIVVDDVWSARDVEPFRAESPRSALLFTTRDGSIAAALGALDHPAGALTRDESRAVLARWAATAPAQLPAEADEIIAECGRLPLALAMTGAMLRRKPAVIWQRQLDILRGADLNRIQAQFPDYPYPTLFRAIEASVEELDAATRERYLALAVLLDNMPAHPDVQQELWLTDEGDAAETAERLIDLSLAQREPDGVSIQLHGLQMDYLRSLYADKEALELIHGAVRLSNPVLARDPAQFVSQLAGRLLAHEDLPAVSAFASRIRTFGVRPWLRTLTPTLTPPGGPLLLQIEAAAPAAQPGEPDGLSALAVTAAHILTAAFTGTDLTVWDLETGDRLRTLSGHTGRVVAVAAAPDGARAASASLDGTIRVWDVPTGEARRTIHYAATAVAFAAQPHQLVAGSDDGAVILFDLETGAVVRTFPGCVSRVSSIGMALGRFVLARAGGGTVVWDLEGGPAPRIETDEPYADTSFVPQGTMAVLPGSGRVASAGDRTLRVWDVNTGETVFTASRQSFGYDQLAALPDGRSVIYACLMDVLEVVDTGTGEIRLKLPQTAMRVASLAVSPDGRRAVTASNSGQVRVWDLHGRPPARVALRHTRWVRAAAIADGGRHAVSVSLDGALMWNLGTGEVAQTFDVDWSLNPFRDTFLTQVPGPWRRTEALLPGGLAVAAVGDGRLQVRKSGSDDADTPGFGEHEGSIEVLRATPDGRRAVTGTDAGVAKIWDLENQREIAPLEGHAAAIADLAIDAATRRVITASMDQTLKVWDLDTGRLLRTLDGHTGAISAVAQVPGRDYVVSAAHDQTVRVWNAASGEPVATFTAEAALMSCAAAPDGVTVIAGEVSGGVHVLRLEGVPEGASVVDPAWSAEPHRPDIGESALVMGTQRQSAGEYAEAEQLFALAAQVRLFLSGPDSPLVAQAFNYLALLYCAQEQYEQALPLFVNGLQIYERSEGAESLNFAINLQNMGMMFASQGDWPKAETAYSRALAILERRLEAPSSIVAGALEGLADVLRHAGRTSEADACSVRAASLRAAEAT
jgi:WD40 repeat protein